MRFANSLLLILQSLIIISCISHRMEVLRPQSPRPALLVAVPAVLVIPTVIPTAAVVSGSRDSATGPPTYTVPMASIASSPSLQLDASTRMRIPVMRSAALPDNRPPAITRVYAGTTLHVKQEVDQVHLLALLPLLLSSPRYPLRLLLPSPVTSVACSVGAISRRASHAVLPLESVTMVSIALNIKAAPKDTIVVRLAAAHPENRLGHITKIHANPTLYVIEPFLPQHRLFQPFLLLPCLHYQTSGFLDAQTDVGVASVIMLMSHIQYLLNPTMDGLVNQIIRWGQGFHKLILRHSKMLRQRKEEEETDLWNI